MFEDKLKKLRSEKESLEEENFFFGKDQNIVNLRSEIKSNEYQIKTLDRKIKRNQIIQNVFHSIRNLVF